VSLARAAIAQLGRDLPTQTETPAQRVCCGRGQVNDHARTDTPGIWNKQAKRNKSEAPPR
jgi:hypothetical protein